MPEVAYLSSTGEVKIPLKLRTQLGLQAGEKFEVGLDDGALVFRRAALPADDQVARFIQWTRTKGKNQGPRTVTITRKAAPGRGEGAKKRPKKKGAPPTVARRRSAGREKP